jgi:hypothetical protein
MFSPWDEYSEQEDLLLEFQQLALLARQSMCETQGAISFSMYRLLRISSPLNVHHQVTASSLRNNFSVLAHRRTQGVGAAKKCLRYRCQRRGYLYPGKEMTMPQICVLKMKQHRNGSN